MNASNLPVRVGDGGEWVAVILHLLPIRAAHQPKQHLPGARVLPQQVGVSVSVHVGNSSDCLICVSDGGEGAAVVRDTLIIHVPGEYLAGVALRHSRSSYVQAACPLADVDRAMAGLNRALLTLLPLGLLGTALGGIGLTGRVLCAGWGKWHRQPSKWAAMT